MGSCTAAESYHIQMHFATDVHGIKGCPSTWQAVEGDVKLHDICKMM